MHGAVISTIARKLQDTEEESAANEYLCNGVRPDDTIIPGALKAPMTAHEERTRKYLGLLIR